MAMRAKPGVRGRKFDELRHRMRTVGNPGRSHAQKIRDFGVSCSQHVSHRRHEQENGQDESAEVAPVLPRFKSMVGYADGDAAVAAIPQGSVWKRGSTGPLRT